LTAPIWRFLWNWLQLFVYFNKEIDVLDKEGEDLLSYFDECLHHKTSSSFLSIFFSYQSKLLYKRQLTFSVFVLLVH
jgi:hypothetical protein